MSYYQFTVIVRGPDLQTEEAINALFDANCDDAAIGSVDGVQYMDFDREAPSFPEAVISAVGEIEGAVAGALVVRIANGGLVSMADIAKRVGRTRESVRLLVSGARGPGGFPPPVTDPRSRYRLWRWSDVAEWMRRELGDEVVDAADPFESAACALLEWRASAARLSQEERQALAALVER